MEAGFSARVSVGLELLLVVFVAVGVVAFDIFDFIFCSTRFGNELYDVLFSLFTFIFFALLNATLACTAL